LVSLTSDVQTARLELTLAEMVPRLLEHLHIPYISLASHSGGDIYLINTLLTYPHLLHPHNPYICFFAPWVHPSHSSVTQMRATSLLPAPVIGKFASVVKFVNDNVIPLVGLSGNIVNSQPRTNTSRTPITLIPTTIHSRFPSINSSGVYQGLDLDDPDVVAELRKHITTFLFAESIDGISADAQLFLRRPRSIPWCSPSIFWSDIDYVVPLLSKMIEEDGRLDYHNRKWIIDAFHAESDDMVGAKGQQWFDDCWLLGRPSTSSTRSNQSDLLNKDPYDSVEYRSEVVNGTDHNYLMDAAFGASELWLQRVRDACPRPLKVSTLKDISSRLHANKNI
jgi:hypothetical protein